MSNTRSDQYNKIQKDLRKFYELDFVILVNHLVSHNIMSIAQIANLLGCSRFAIISRLDRYRLEQEIQEEEEEEEDNDPGDTDDNSYEEARDAYDLSIEYENNLYNSME